MATKPLRAEEPDDLSPATLEALKLARSNATRFRVREVSVLHLMLGIVEQGDTPSRYALERAGIEVKDICAQMERLFGPPNDSDEDGQYLPLSAEILDCLNWARSLLPNFSTGKSDYPTQVSPALLFIALLRLPRVQSFLSPLLPSLRTIFALLRQGILSAYPTNDSFPSINFPQIEREIDKTLSAAWFTTLSPEVIRSFSFYSQMEPVDFSSIDKFLRTVQGKVHDQTRTWNIVRFSQGNVKRMLRSIVRPNPGGRFADLIGFHSAKRQLQEVVDLLATPPEFRRDEQKPLHGVLLVGPADNDRTLLARAIAGEANVPLVTLSCGALFDMLTDLSVGTRTIEDLNLPILEHNKLKQSDTTTAGQNLLKSFFAQAREDAPCLVLLDELDTLLRLTSEARIHFFEQLLLEMDALDKQTVVVATASDALVLSAILFHTSLFVRIVEMQKDEAEEQTTDLESKGTDVDPWIAFAQHYTSGQVVEGVVTRVTSFGLFVRVAEGVEGLVLRSKVGGGDITPEELSTRIHENEHVTVCILSIDAKRHRLALSMDISASSDMLHSFMKKQQIVIDHLRQSAAAIPERGKYILVVDNHPVERRVVHDMLTQHGWAVQTADNGVEALETIDLAKTMGYPSPAAVLLEIELPHMDGYELISMIRAQPQHKTLPIVVLTSRAASKHRQRAMALGADGYVVKPYQDDELLNILNSLVHGTVAPQSTRSFERHCPSCQHTTEPTWQYCSFCGTSLASVCPHCGAPRADVDGARFCFECGNAFE